MRGLKPCGTIHVLKPRFFNIEKTKERLRKILAHRMAMKLTTFEKVLSV